MIWLSWRQQRTETLMAGVLLVLLAALFVPVGVHVADAYRQDGVAACVGRQTPTCGVVLANFGAQAGLLRSALGWFTLLPGLIGVALAAPLVLDLESGTSVFAWTQGLTRRRWVLSKLGVAVATALGASGLLTLLVAYYRSPLDAVYGRLHRSVYDVEGVVPLSYALFALGLTLAVGVVWRRTAPAVVAAFLGYVGARLFVDQWLRQRLLTPHEATWGVNAHGPDLGRAWIISLGSSDRAGHPFTGSIQVVRSCARAVGSRLRTLDPACLTRHGAGYQHAVYVPAGSFWTLQAIETALFGGIALALLGFAAWWLLRRAE